MADVSQIKLPNGSVYDLIDEKSGYITAEYIENKTDYEIPVSRVGEIVVGETAIGTDSTNFPTSKAVVDYVDERVVQEIAAIDVGVISVNGKTGSVTLNASDVGAATINQIPTSTSQLTNDSGFITSYTDTKVEQVELSNSFNLNKSVLLSNDNNSGNTVTGKAYKHDGLYYNPRYKQLTVENIQLGSWAQPGTITIGGVKLTSVAEGSSTITFPITTGTVALTSDIPIVPTNISSFTNDSGYLTASDIASVMTYKGTKANYAALPASGNITGDVWHLTDTGAEWAWDGSAWQELGTAIDLSNYLTTSDIAAWAKASTKPTYTAAEVGALPDTTTIPSKTSDLTNDSGFVERFVVTITGNDAVGYSADKTFSEITTAHNNGYEVVCIGPGGSTIPSLEFDADMVLFEFSAMTVDNIPAGELVRINASNETFYSFITYTESDPTVPGWAKAPSKPSYELTEISGTDDLRVIEGLTGTTGLLKKTAANTWTLDTNTYLTSYTETDPTVPSWAKQSSKPSYGLTEISGTDDLRAIEALTGTSGLLKKTAANTWTLDTNTYLTSYTETDPTVPSWAKASTKPTYTAVEVGALPDSTVIPSKTSELTNDSGFITSYIDEKVKATALTFDDIEYYPIFGDSSGIAKTKNYTTAFGIGCSSTYNRINLKLGTASIAGQIILYRGQDSNRYATIKANTVTSSRTITIPDKTGTIALTSDIPDTSSFLTSETDPVFSASAAAGITSTDISNWNGKSSTDEKVKSELLSTATICYPVFSNDNSTTTSTLYKIKGFSLSVPNNSAADGVVRLELGYASSIHKTGAIRLFSSNQYGVIIQPKTGFTAHRNVYLQDKDGTIALTSDIPTVYSSTNTGGYLTMATLPIYDGTVE